VDFLYENAGEGSKVGAVNGLDPVGIPALNGGYPMSTTPEIDRTTHTPGPWKVDDYHEEECIVVAADGFPIGYAQQVCILPGYDEKLKVTHWSSHKGKAYVERPIEQAQANARLMAAAPDLLAAAKLIASFAVSWQPLTPGDIKELTNAIAKAEGR